MMYLTKGGRVTLMKCTLSNLPTSCLFFFSRLVLPTELRSYSNTFCGLVSVISSNFIWLASLKCVLRSLKKGWGSIIYFCSSERCWGSDFGIMFMFMRERERPYGRWLWILNMAACGMGGVLIRFMGCMGWGYGTISEGVGRSFLIILDMRSMMYPKLDFGMTCDVGIMPSRQLAGLVQFSPLQGCFNGRSFGVFQ
jgi:hypothetical protein